MSHGEQGRVRRWIDDHRAAGRIRRSVEIADRIFAEKGQLGRLGAVRDRQDAVGCVAPIMQSGRPGDVAEFDLVGAGAAEPLDRGVEPLAVQSNRSPPVLVAKSTVKPLATLASNCNIVPGSIVKLPPPTRVWHCCPPVCDLDRPVVGKVDGD